MKFSHMESLKVKGFKYFFLMTNQDYPYRMSKKVLYENLAATCRLTFVSNASPSQRGTQPIPPKLHASRSPQLHKLQ